MNFLKRWLPVAVWAGIILASSNDSFSSGQTAGWLQAVFGQALPELVNHLIRKAGHLLAYGLLGALAWRAARRAPLALGVTALVATIDETHQSLTLTRSGSPWDVLLDVAGACLAIYVIVPAVRARLSSRRSAA